MQIYRYILIIFVDFVFVKFVSVVLSLPPNFSAQVKKEGGGGGGEILYGDKKVTPTPARFCVFLGRAFFQEIADSNGVAKIGFWVRRRRQKGGRVTRRMHLGVLLSPIPPPILCSRHSTVHALDIKREGGGGRRRRRRKRGKFIPPPPPPFLFPLSFEVTWRSGEMGIGGHRNKTLKNILHFLKSLCTEILFMGRHSVLFTYYLFSVDLWIWSARGALPLSCSRGRFPGTRGRGRRKEEKDRDRKQGRREKSLWRE